MHRIITFAFSFQNSAEEIFLGAHRTSSIYIFIDLLPKISIDSNLMLLNFSIVNCGITEKRYSLFIWRYLTRFECFWQIGMSVFAYFYLDLNAKSIPNAQFDSPMVFLTSFELMIYPYKYILKNCSINQFQTNVWKYTRFFFEKTLCRDMFFPGDEIKKNIPMNKMLMKANDIRT